MAGFFVFQGGSIVSIIKKRDSAGRLRHQVYVYNAACNKKVYVGTFDRMKDAQEAEYEAKRRLRLGESIKPVPSREEMTFDALAKRWHKGLVSVRPSTKSDYDKALRRIKPLLGSSVVSAITRRNVGRKTTNFWSKFAE